MEFPNEDLLEFELYQSYPNIHSESSGLGSSERSSMDSTSSKEYMNFPMLQIVEEPKSSAFFQNQSQLQNNKCTRIESINSNNINKTFPSVKLLRDTYDGDVLMTCTPYAQRKNSLEKDIHPSRLIDQSKRILSKSSKLSKNLMDPIEFVSKSGIDSEFVVEAAILVPGKRSIFKREKPLINIKNFDLEIVFLCFEAYEYKDGVKGNSICGKIFSKPILNEASKNASKLSSSKSSNPTIYSSSSTSGPSSPTTSESSSPEYNQLQSPIMSLNSINSTDSVRLEIIEQPEKTSYFRNESEVENDKHGHIKGRSNKKKFPTVKLVGYRSSNNALITCTPICMKNKTEMCIHPYRLVKQDRSLLSDIGVMDPYESTAIYKEDYVVKIEATIMIPGKESLYLRDGTLITKETRKNYDLQKMCLRFDAYELVNGQQGNRIAKSIYSDPIGNQRSVATKELEIKELTPLEGNVKGKTRVWLRCERVDYKDIQVRFSIGDSVEYAEVEQVHHQYLVIFYTPTFKNLQNITEPVYVDVQLQRKSDGSLSENAEFKYTPCGKSLKRCSSEDSIFSSNVESDRYDDDDDNYDDLKNSKFNKIRKVESKCYTNMNANIENSKIEYKITPTIANDNKNLAIQCNKIDTQYVNNNDDTDKNLEATCNLTTTVDDKELEIQRLVNCLLENNDNYNEFTEGSSKGSNVAASSNEYQDKSQECTSENDVTSGFDEQINELTSYLEQRGANFNDPDTLTTDGCNLFESSFIPILQQSKINDSINFNINNCGSWTEFDLLNF